MFSGKVYLVSTKELLEKTMAQRNDPGEFRIYLGYCGWGPGQLENETGHGFWHIFASDADLVFDSEPNTLWSRLIARVGQNIAQRSVPTSTVSGPTYRLLGCHFSTSERKP